MKKTIFENGQHLYRQRIIYPCLTLPEEENPKVCGVASQRHFDVLKNIAECE